VQTTSSEQLRWHPEIKRYHPNGVGSGETLKAKIGAMCRGKDACEWLITSRKVTCVLIVHLDELFIRMENILDLVDLGTGVPVG
jgi:hypothetical protein